MNIPFCNNERRAYEAGNVTEIECPQCGYPADPAGFVDEVCCDCNDDNDLADDRKADADITDAMWHAE